MQVEEEVSNVEVKTDQNLKSKKKSLSKLIIMSSIKLATLNLCLGLKAKKDLVKGLVIVPRVP